MTDERARRLAALKRRIAEKGYARLDPAQIPTALAHDADAIRERVAETVADVREHLPSIAIHEHDDGTVEFVGAGRN